MPGTWSLSRSGRHPTPRPPGQLPPLILHELTVSTLFALLPFRSLLHTEAQTTLLKCKLNRRVLLAQNPPVAFITGQGRSKVLAGPSGLAGSHLSVALLTPSETPGGRAVDLAMAVTQT